MAPIKKREGNHEIKLFTCPSNSHNFVWKAGHGIDKGGGGEGDGLRLVGG